MPQMNRAIHCLAPVIGIFSGFAVGFVIHFFVPPSGTMDFAVRLLTLFLGILGWAVSVVIDGKKLHCGGTQELDHSTRKKYRCQIPVVLAFLVLVPFLLLKENWWLYFLVMFFVLGSFVGEIGWGDWRIWKRAL
jgi:ABC-type antimicrobial peptide transport system permease subunit